MREKCKLLFPNLLDFIILTSILSITAISVYGIKFILYSDTREGERITLLSESVPERLSGELEVNDTLFDTLTKRRVGEINELHIIKDGEGRVKFIITVDALFIPRSESLRTRKLWFRYSELDEDAASRLQDEALIAESEDVRNE